MKRRRAIGLGSAALLGAAAGAGWYAWRGPRQAEQPEAALDAVTAGMWRMRFPQPGGGELDMAGLLGRPMLLNFWATWCAPCIKEMPELDRFQRANPALVVVGLAVDNAAPVQEFLLRTPVSYRIALAGFGGAQLSRELGNNVGALPFTVLFEASGRIAARKLGETTFAELQTWVKRLKTPG
jgi:thiol-disulfide isomerase/thioredoxin